MRLVKRFALIACSLQLAACNLVVSDEPMLERDAEAPVMKPGIWVDAGEEACAFDPATPVLTWPDCADAAVFDENGDLYSFDRKSGSWKGIELVLGSGDPAVAQVRLPKELTGGSELAPTYIYAGLRAVQSDADGLVTAFRTWPMVCGPVAQNDTELPSEPAVTDAPFAGLTIVGQNCRAEDIAALQNAARQSEALVESPGGARWVREAAEVRLD